MNYYYCTVEQTNVHKVQIYECEEHIYRCIQDISALGVDLGSPNHMCLQTCERFYFPYFEAFSTQ